ncbi:MAG TPA: DUF2490 domain-containing protein [Chitinophagaceae bacterium]
MKKIFSLSLFQLLLSVFFHLSAQSSFTGWLASFNTFKTGKKTSVHTDVQLRSTDEIKQIQTVLIRPGLNVHLNKHLTVTAGYAFISNKRIINTTSGFAPEHRIWEQVLINHKLKSIFVSHRFRLEQRFISKSIVVNNELETDGSVYANRFRYFIRNILPFKNEPVFKKGLFAALQNEVFLNFGNTSTVNGETFDQNRLYIAVGYRLRATFDLEAGYMNQYINGRGKTFVNTHVLQLAGYLRL